ncbi:hypothetical protein AMECASPLE_037548, partial [Ameca splendens]
MQCLECNSEDVSKIIIPSILSSIHPSVHPSSHPFINPSKDTPQLVLGDLSAHQEKG